MALTSITYVLFIAASVIALNIFPGKAKKYILLLLNGIYYTSFSVTDTLYLLFGILVTFLGGFAIEWSHSVKCKKIALGTTLIINVGMLAVLKYTPFICSDVVNPLFHTDISLQNWAVPLGLSFFVFQSSTYVIDLYRGQVSFEKNIVRYACFVSFFPSIMSGPILRAKNFLPQIRKMDMEGKEKNGVSYRNIKIGFWQVIWGLFQKMVIADR